MNSSQFSRRTKSVTIAAMVQRNVLDYENRLAKATRQAPADARLSYHVGVAFGSIFAWWALSTAVDVSDPFIAHGDYVDPGYFFNHYLIFPPLIAVLTSIAFEFCRCITRSDLPTSKEARLDGPIVTALFLPSAYFALVFVGLAYTADIRFPQEITRPQFACFCIASLSAVALIGCGIGKSDKPDNCWGGAGWAAPCVLVSNFEGFKYFGQYVSSSPGGVNEYSIGGFLYWATAFAVGLLAVPLFARLFLVEIKPQSLAARV